MNSNATIITSLLLATGAGAAADEIVLKRSVRMRHDGNSVLLADVAEIDGEHARAYSDLEVGRFEDFGRPLEITVGEIAVALDRAGANRARFDLTGNRVVIRPFAGRNPVTGGPAACRPLSMEAEASTAPGGDAASMESATVAPEDQEVILDPRGVITEDTARGLIAERLLAGIEHREEGPIRMRLRLRDPELLTLRERRPSLVATGRAADGALGFRILLDGNLAGTAVAVIERKTLVYRARADLRRGEVVDVDDVTVRSEWTVVGKDPRREAIASMLGSKLETRVTAGTILESTHFTPVIRRNMPIKVRSGGTGWSMMIDCIALEAGRPGDTITVRSDTTGTTPRDVRPIRVVVEDANNAILVD